MVISKSFARIHETNLKKQGVIPLTFKNEKDYDKLEAGSIFATQGLSSLAPGSPVSLCVTPPSGNSFNVELEHTLSADQIQWIRAGSALNLIASSS
jgi:aconitase A